MIAKAPTLTILLPIYDSNGVMRFTNSGGPFFGVHCVIDQSMSLSQQAINAVESFLGRGDLHGKIEPVIAIEPVLKAEGHSPSLLYLMRVKDQGLRANTGWLTIMHVLRSLPAGSNRVAYNKVLQLLAGAADAEVSVLEMDYEVRQRLLQLMSETPNSLVE